MSISNHRISSFFEEDHDKLDALFKKFVVSQQAEPAVATEVFGRFTAGLLRHIHWEEEILFPLFEANEGSSEGPTQVNEGSSGGPTQVMRSEHALIKDLLEGIRLSLEKGTDSAEHERTLLNVLGEHNWKEEHVLYPAMDRQLTNGQLAEVFDRIAATM